MTKKFDKFMKEEKEYWKNVNGLDKQLRRGIFLDREVEEKEIGRAHV